MTNVAIWESRQGVLAGILLASLSYLLFSTQDAAIKFLVADLTVVQILFFRSATILIGSGLFGGKKIYIEAIRSPIFNAMLFRSFLILIAWLCYYTAAKHLQLAKLTTIYFAAPIIVTVLSIFVLGEKVPVIRWIAVLLGFVGVFIACDPTRLGLSMPVLLVLTAAFFWGLAIVLLRKIAMQERTLIQLILNNGFFLIIAGLPLLFFWRTPDPATLVLLIGVGVLGGTAQFLLFEGMKRAAASIIAPFEYTSLVWAFALGFAIWGDVPRTEVFVGAALIVAAGLIIVTSERLRRS